MVNLSFKRRFTATYKSFVASSLASVCFGFGLGSQTSRYSFLFPKTTKQGCIAPFGAFCFLGRAALSVWHHLMHGAKGSTDNAISSCMHACTLLCKHYFNIRSGFASRCVSSSTRLLSIYSQNFHLARFLLGLHRPSFIDTYIHAHIYFCINSVV